MNKEILDLQSAGSITHYGDVYLTLHDSRPVILEPNHLEEGALFIGQLPSHVPLTKNETLKYSVKSALAQVGVDMHHTEVESNRTIWSVIVNSGCYSLLFESAVAHNFGAIFSHAESNISMKDIRRYYHRLQTENRHLDQENFALLEFEKPVIWIETPQMLGSQESEHIEQPINVSKLPRGSDRQAMNKRLRRRVVTTSTNRKRVEIDLNKSPFSILQTQAHINPVVGHALMIEGYAILGPHNRIILRGTHGESKLVAQPENTHEQGRGRHEIIAEIYEREEYVIANWKKGNRIGFYGYPVKLNKAVE